MKNFMTWKHVGVGCTVAVLLGGCNPTGAPGGDGAAGKTLVANLRGADGAAADLEFREDGERSEFTLAIRGGTPGATVELTVNGAVVLSVTLDDFGNARVRFDSAPDELDEDELPAGFPGADDGDEVGVGGLTGQFEEKDDDEGDDNGGGDDDDGDDDDEGGKDDAEEFELEAFLSAADSSLQAKVKFESEGEERELEVHVRGGAPGSTHDFVLDGVALGTLTLDEFGYAKLEFDSEVEEGESPFPAGFVNPVAGSVVAVGSMSGNLQVESDDDSHDGDDDGDDDDAEDEGDDDADDNSNDNDDDGSADNSNDNADDNTNDNTAADNTNDNAADDVNDNVDDNENDNV